MATWAQITDQMYQHYAVHNDEQHLIAVEITLNSGRTQRVLMRLEEEIPGHPLVTLFSPFADLRMHQVDVTQILSNWTQLTGLAIQGGALLGYIWSWPLANIDPTDLHIVLRLLVNHADAQERAFLGTDTF